MVKRIISFFITVIIFSNQLATTVMADPNFDERFYSSNDILFYDPRCDTGTAQGEIISLEGKDNIDKIMKFLIAPAQGLTVAQAAGVIGNLMAESGDSINPAIIQGGGNAPPTYTPVNGVGFGIAQWTFTARQAPLVEYMKPYGDITNLDGQIGFLWSELNGTHSEALRKLKETTDYQSATYVFHKYYEGSADSEQQVRQGRGGKAEQVFKMYADRPSVVSDNDSSALSNGDATATRDSGTSRTGARSCTPTAAGGSLIDLVKQYAWPEYRGLTTTPTDAYREAVQTAISQRRYVGGTSYPGIDCGGFVTTLIIDSKFDTEYNNGSELARGAGNTIAQEAWMKKNWREISASDATDRQPGDVAINSTHTYIYVGPDAFPNHEPIASASWDERAPMQGREAVAGDSFRWYRKNASAPTTSVPRTAGGGGGSW